MMILPFLLNVIAIIWGGGSAEAGEEGSLGGMMFSAVALVIFVVGVWCLSESETATKDA